MEDIENLVVQIMSGDKEGAAEAMSNILTQRAAERIEGMKQETMSKMFGESVFVDLNQKANLQKIDTKQLRSIHALHSNNARIGTNEKAKAAAKESANRIHDELKSRNEKVPFID